MQQRSEETRARILEAALRRFAVQGYNAASIDQICTEAGVSKGAFYHHFPSKQAIFLELLNGWLETINAGFEAVRQGTVPETLMAMTGTLPAIFASAGDQLPMFLEFWLQASREEHIWEATIAPYRQYRDYFTELVQQGIQEGTLAPTDPRIAAQMIVSLAVGLLLQGLIDPHGADWEQVGRESIQVILKGLGK